MNEENNDLDPIIAALGFGLGGNSKAARSMRAKLQRRDRKGQFAFQGGGFMFNIRFPDGVSKLSGRVVGASGTEDVEIEVKGDDRIPDGIYALPSSKGDSVAAILPKDALKDLPDVDVRASERLAIDANTLKRMEQPTGWTKTDTPEGEPEIWTSEDGYFAKKDGDVFTLHRADLSDNSIGEEVARGNSWADVQKAALEDQDDYEKVLEAASSAESTDDQSRDSKIDELFSEFVEDDEISNLESFLDDNGADTTEQNFNEYLKDNGIDGDINSEDDEDRVKAARRDFFAELYSQDSDNLREKFAEYIKNRDPELYDERIGEPPAAKTPREEYIEKVKREFPTNVERADSLYGRGGGREEDDEELDLPNSEVLKLIENIEDIDDVTSVGDLARFRAEDAAQKLRNAIGEDQFNEQYGDVLPEIYDNLVAAYDNYPDSFGGEFEQIVSLTDDLKKAIADAEGDGPGEPPTGGPDIAGPGEPPTGGPGEPTDAPDFISPEAGREVLDNGLDAVSTALRDISDEDLDNLDEEDSDSITRVGDLLDSARDAIDSIDPVGSSTNDLHFEQARADLGEAAQILSEANNGDMQNAGFNLNEALNQFINLPQIDFSGGRAERAGREAQEPEPADGLTNFDPANEMFDEMFEAPDGAYKPKILDVYEPKGRQEDNSLEYTDDPSILSNRFSPSELIFALREAVTTVNGEEASGFGSLDFGDGDELVPAEALYEALDLSGANGRKTLAAIYDAELGPEAGSPNMQRFEIDMADMRMLDDADLQPLDKTILSDEEAIELNRRLSLPSNAQILIDEMNDYVETNTKIQELADFLKQFEDIDEYNPNALTEALNNYLPFAFSSDKEEQDTFKALWGMLMSLDGSSSEKYDQSSLFRGPLMRAFEDRFGDSWELEYDSFLDEFGGFETFVQGKNRIVNGEEDLDSGSVGANFLRLMKASSKVNEVELQRSFGVSIANPTLVSKYTTVGNIFALDPRPFTTGNLADEDIFQAFSPTSSTEHRVVLVAAPGELESTSAIGISWFTGEKEHLGHGEFEVVSVDRKPASRLRAGAPDDLIVTIKKANTSIEDLAAEDAISAPQAAQDVPAREIKDVSNWTRTGDQTGGSNSGAFYEDENGQGYYVKVAKSQSHAENETLASAFYDALGAPSAEVSVGDMNGRPRVVSKLIPNSVSDLGSRVRSGDEEYLDKLREHFIVDAWLANYDVTGTGFDNVMSDGDGNPIRIDPGGALMWRAQGAPKSTLGMFTEESDYVPEIDSLRDIDINYYASSVFGSLTDDDIRAQAERLRDSMSPERIDAIVDSIITDPADAEFIKERLQNRRQGILDRFGLEDRPALTEPVSIEDSMGYAAQDLQPGDVTVGDSFTVERVFRDEDTPKGKVSVEGYFPGHQTQRKEWNEGTVIDAMRGGSTPPKGDREPLHRPKKPGYAPTAPSFSGGIAEELEAAQSWAEIRDILADKDIIYFDYETTGLGFESQNRPVQLGAVKVRNGQVIDRFNMFVDPNEELSEWSRKNLRDADGNPLTDEYLSQQAGMGEVHSLFADWMGENPILAAHNLPFDREILERIAREESIDFSPDGYIDTLALARDLLKKKTSKNPDGPEGHRLPQLLEHYGMGLEGWHAADVDAEAVSNLLRSLIDDAAGREDISPDTFDFKAKQAKYEEASKAYNENVEKYKDELAEYEAKKAVAAAWNCGGGGGLTAAATEDGNSDCNVPSIDDMINNASVKPGELSDPESITSGDTAKADSPYDDDVTDIVDVKDMFPIEGESYPPTSQQQAIINAVLSDENADTVVRAAAGAGKTSTLIALAKRFQKYKPDKKIIYIAFNRSVADEAKAKMPPNVEVRTADSISYNWVNTNLPELGKKKGNPDRLVKPSDIVSHLDVPSVREGDSKVSATKMVKELRKAVYEFTISADKELGPQHFEKTELTEDLVTPEVIAAAQRWWADVLDPKGKMPFDFNHMKKLWSLSDPDLSDTSSGLKTGADVVFVDEFQDTNDVLGTVVNNQPNTQNVYVGDENQAIYQFMGANDWLQKVEADNDLPITQSFRFGPTVARQGNRFLRFKERYLDSKKTFSVEGAGKTEGTLVAPNTMEDADAVLVRSNSGAFKEVRQEIMNGRTVGVTKGFKKDLDDFIAAVDWLQGDPASRSKRPARMPEDLRQFDSWQKVVDESKDENNDFSRKLNILINDVEELGLEELKNLTKQVKVVTGAGDKKDVESMPSLPDDLSVGIESADGIGKDIGFKVVKDGVVITGKTFDVKDKIKSSNSGVKWDKARGGWFIPSSADDASRRQRLQNVQNSVFSESEKQGGQVDVVVTTVHQAKGLEWPKVRMGKDFFGPRKRKGMEQATPEDRMAWIMPSESEIHLAYVAVTRAENELDLGSLSWIDGWVADEDPEVNPDVNAPEAPEAPEADAPEVADLQESDVSEAPDTVVEAPQPTKIKYAVAGQAPSEEKKQADLEDTISELENIIKDLTAPESKKIKQPSVKSGVRKTGEKFDKLNEDLKSGKITQEEAISILNDIIDDMPEGKGDDGAQTDTVTDFLIDIRRILDGTFYQRQTGPNLPPIDSSRGYSKDGIFLVPGVRVRDKWGYAGTVDRYAKAEWINVYVTRDIGTPEKPTNFKQSKNTQQLTTIPEGGDDRPWAWVAGMPLNKLPDNWRETSTPGEIADIEAAMAKEASKGKKSSAKDIPPGDDDDGDGGGGGGVTSPPGDDDGGDSPKAEAPEGAPEVPEEESPITVVEESSIDAAGIKPEWQTMPQDASAEDIANSLTDYYAKNKFSVEKNDLTDEEIAAAQQLLEYTQDDYYMVNRELRDSSESSLGDVDPDALKIVNAIDSLMDAAPTLPQDLVLYRGIHSAYSNKVIMTLNVGDLFTDKGFVSTSFDSEVAEDFSSYGSDLPDTSEGSEIVLEIVAPEGTRGIFVPGYFKDDPKNEQEIILDRGTTFRVISKVEDSRGILQKIRVAVVDQKRAGYREPGSNERFDFSEVTPAGRPTPIIENPKTLSESSFENVNSLMAAIDSVVNRTTTAKNTVAAVDGPDIEDMEVKVSTLVDSITQEKSLRLRFKLTSWAGVAQRERASKKDSPWEAKNEIEIPKTTLLPNGDIRVDKEKSSLLTYDESYAKTYSRDLPIDAGVAKIQLLQGRPRETLGVEKNDYATPTALHHLVTIDLPIDATESDIKRAIEAAGVREARAAAPEDLRILAENKLLSIFLNQTDPSKNMTDQLRRDNALEKIKARWGVSAEDVEIATDDLGFLTFKLPESTAEAYTEEAGVFALQHQLAPGRIAFSIYQEDPSIGYDSPELRKLTADYIVNLITGAGLVSTTNRFLSGINISGMSSQEDIGTGGADYVFTSPVRSPATADPSYGDAMSVLFDPKKVFQRADFYANPRDEYGRRYEASSSLEAIQDGGSNAEVMSKHGLGPKDLMGMIVGPDYYSYIMDSLKEKNIAEINGTPIEQFVSATYYNPPSPGLVDSAGVPTQFGQATTQLIQSISAADGAFYTANYDSTDNDGILGEFNRIAGTKLAKATLPFDEEDAQIVGFLTDEEGGLIIRDAKTNNLYIQKSYAPMSSSPQFFALGPTAANDTALKLIQGYNAGATIDTAIFENMPVEAVPLTSPVGDMTNDSNINYMKAKLESFSAEDSDKYEYVDKIANYIVASMLLAEPHHWPFLGDYFSAVSDLFESFPEVKKRVQIVTAPTLTW